MEDVYEEGKSGAFIEAKRCHLEPEIELPVRVTVLKEGGRIPSAEGIVARSHLIERVALSGSTLPQGGGLGLESLLYLIRRACAAVRYSKHPEAKRS